MAEFRNELSAEAGYLTSQTGPNQYTVYKVDPTTDPVNVLAKHAVINGVCDCEGFKHRMKCRHVEMIQSRPKPVNRAIARADASEVISSWGDRFERMVFDDYEFTDAEETLVKTVKIKAHGKPIHFDGVDHFRITGITKAGTWVVVDIIK